METATLHEMWSTVAPAWGEHARYVDARAADLTARMLGLTDPRPGEDVLELACGAGGLGLAVAERIAPGGEVVLSDVAPEMTAIAAARAEERGLTNVTPCVLDFEAIDQPDDRFDVVLCREGLMFASEPARAAGEIARVLRPGGRAAIGVWAERERNPWLGLVFDAVAVQLGRPVPPPGIPGPFSLGEPGRLRATLRDGGLGDVVVEEIAVPLRAPSFDAWWSRTSALAGPLAAILAGLPAPAAAAIRDRLRETTAPYRTSSGLEFPGVALVGFIR
jgi:enediyne biosynthesis protein CalE5